MGIVDGYSELNQMMALRLRGGTVQFCDSLFQESCWPLAGGVGLIKVAVVKDGACLGEKESRNFSKHSHSHHTQRDGRVFAEEGEEFGYGTGVVCSGGEFANFCSRGLASLKQFFDSLRWRERFKVVIGENQSHPCGMGVSDCRFELVSRAELDVDECRHGDKLGEEGPPILGEQSSCAAFGRVAGGKDQGQLEFGDGADQWLEIGGKGIEANFEEIEIGWMDAKGVANPLEGVNGSDHRRSDLQISRTF
jgi:hypothetical protein